MSYQRMKKLPAYEMQADGVEFEEFAKLDAAKWSARFPAPKVGQRIETWAFGPGEVRGYFIENGWFGVLVKLESPPDWMKKQNPKGRLVHLFGVDLQEEVAA
jgi:hypothetical protein